MATVHMFIIPICEIQQIRSYSCEQRLYLWNIYLLWWIFDFVSSSEWTTTTKKSFINQSEPGVEREDRGMDRRLQGFRFKHSLLTQNSQTGEGEWKPQGDKEIFEVTLRTSLKPLLTRRKDWSILYLWIWPYNFIFGDKVHNTEEWI